MCRGKEVAVKKLFKQDLDEKSLMDFRKEVEIMAQLRHPNVLLFMGACTEKGSMVRGSLCNCWPSLTALLRPL